MFRHFYKNESDLSGGDQLLGEICEKQKGRKRI